MFAYQLDGRRVSSSSVTNRLNSMGTKIRSAIKAHSFNPRVNSSLLWVLQAFLVRYASELNKERRIVAAAAATEAKTTRLNRFLFCLQADAAMLYSPLIHSLANINCCYMSHYNNNNNDNNIQD